VRIASLDHVVLTVADIEATIGFYERVLGMRRVDPSTPGPPGVAFGNQKLNLHQVGKELSPRAARATAGSADVCFLVDGSLDAVIAELAAQRVPIEEGPIERVGAQGRMMSVYFRDPDGNLLEVAELL
jgi:catechol 2,3-dioxygenase-like lactoylglutathione lyase family enzyme